MESNIVYFNPVNKDLFDSIDLMIENEDNKGMSEMIYEQFEDLKTIDKNDFFATIVPVSIISSIVCNLDDDLMVDEDNFVVDDCNAIYFSEVIEEMALSGKIEEAMEYVEMELISRERYELLNEMKKYGSKR
jgi:hypothetical protein